VQELLPKYYYSEKKDRRCATLNVMSQSQTATRWLINQNTAQYNTLVLWSIQFSNYPDAECADFVSFIL